MWRAQFDSSDIAPIPKVGNNRTRRRRVERYLNVGTFRPIYAATLRSVNVENRLGCRRQQLPSCATVPRLLRSGWSEPRASVPDHQLGRVGSLLPLGRLTAVRQEFTMWSWKTPGARSIGSPNPDCRNISTGHELPLGGWADKHCVELVVMPARRAGL